MSENQLNLEERKVPELTTESIDGQLDKAEEEDQEEFNKWFNLYVGNDAPINNMPINDSQSNDSTSNDVQTNDAPTNEQETNDSPINDAQTNDAQTNDTPTNDSPTNDAQTNDSASNDAQTNDAQTNDAQTKDAPTNDAQTNEQETNDSPTNDALINDAPTIDTPTKVSNPTLYTISDLTKSKPKTKQDITITKHRKHHTRKTEISASVPPKQPITIQETEQGKIEIGTTKSEKLTDEQLEKKLHNSAAKLISDIQTQVQEMEENGNCKKLDVIDYTPGSEKYNIFKHFVLDNLFVPKRCTTRFNLNEYISSITTFSYNCFDSPNVSMQHPIPEKVIFMEKMNKIFNHKFVNNQGGEFHFADLDIQLLEFISSHKNLGTLGFEYKFIKSSLGKLILNLNTDVELALRDVRPTLNSTFKQVVIKDIQSMKHIQSENGKTFVSWKSFLDGLFGIGADKLIYVHDNYRNLNVKLEKAYSTDFLVENLCANMLKCYLPSIALNYFYAIKSIYIIARLVSIYIQLELFKNKTVEQVMNDLFAITVAGTITYENKSFIYKQTSRTLPTYNNELSNETKLYILNHLLTGGQYFILKMIEESIPVIASDLVKK